MSEQDRVRPYHARDTATGQETADVVAEVLRHAAERDQAAKQRNVPKRQPKWMLPVSVNLAVLAVYLLIAPPDWAVLNPIPELPIEARVDDFRTAMYFQGIARIEVYRARTGRLPATLQEAGSTLQGVDYVVRGDSAYVLIGSVGEEVLTYDSSVESAAAFAGNVSSKISG
jgi:hypothetical protein